MAININNIDPRRLTLEDYSVSDVNLISEFTTAVEFNPSSSYINTLFIIYMGLYYILRVKIL